MTLSNMCESKFSELNSEIEKYEKSKILTCAAITNAANEIDDLEKNCPDLNREGAVIASRLIYVDRNASKFGWSNIEGKCLDACPCEEDNQSFKTEIIGGTRRICICPKQMVAADEYERLRKSIQPAKIVARKKK